MVVLLIVIGAVVGIQLALIAGVPAWWLFVHRRRRPDDGGFRYVYIDDEGRAFELAADERLWLITRLEGGHHASPCIKTRYRSRTLCGRCRSGYLERGQLPKRIPILPPTQASDRLDLDILALPVNWHAPRTGSARLLVRGRSQGSARDTFAETSRAWGANPFE